MSWYKKAQQGEWWIVDGQPLFADGQIGDKDHATYVIEHVRQKYAANGYNNGEDVDWDGFKRDLGKKNLQKRLKASSPEEAEKLNDKFYGYHGDHPELYEPEMKALGMTDEEINIANIGTEVDFVGYGLRKLGWKRVVGNNVETSTLTAEDVRQIADGLYDAYGDMEFDGSGMDDKLFNIDVSSNRLELRGVPYRVLSSGNIGELVAYGRRPLVFASWYKSASIDDDYLKALHKKDTVAAQKIIDEAAKVAGYSIGPVWHGSRKSGFFVFQIPSQGFNSNVFGSYEAERNAVFFTDDSDVARGYQTQGDVTSGETRKFYLEGTLTDYVDLRKGIPEPLWNSLVSDGVNERWLSQHQSSWCLFDREQDPDGALVSSLKKLRYSGAIINDTNGTTDFTSFVVFSPESIKLADPITYDQGKPVLPSKRFNCNSTDVRY